MQDPESWRCGLDCTAIFEIEANPHSRSDPEGDLRAGSSSETRSLMASPVSKATGRKSDGSGPQRLSLAIGSAGE